MSNEEVISEHVYLCRADEVAATSLRDELLCSFCGEKMTLIGWFESVSIENEPVVQLLGEVNENE